MLHQGFGVAPAFAPASMRPTEGRPKRRYPLLWQYLGLRKDWDCAWIGHQGRRSSVDRRAKTCKGHAPFALGNPVGDKNIRFVWGASVAV
jgi:hypothetical protein